MFKQNKKAFTLIELLVVVLIIGILAAIALPQYQKAVEKTKAAQAQIVLKIVYNAYEMYYLTHGVLPTSFSQLDINIPWEPTDETDIQRENQDWSIYFSTYAKYDGVAVRRKTGPYTNAHFYIWRKYENIAAIKNQTRSILCGEARSTFVNDKRGIYCKKLIHATYIAHGSHIDYYKMP